jgi:(E)-4-hydroxy-3-methylbut-2-enyl-diphosphate synthase
MFQSRTINIGNILMGGKVPVVIQSMTNTDTNDVDASVEQCIRIIDAGAEMVRLTTQSLREVKSLEKIKKELNKRGYNQPLVADVHFQPKVAEEAARIVEKVRINPGNYIERKYEGPRNYSRLEQNKQIEKIREKLVPLIDICKEHNTSIRIGVNHGSLSERILNWYGNSSEGMVESAMEFARIFEREKFKNLVISLKASNTRMMIQANRLLAKRMYEEDLFYPLHLGVTEAGNEEDGRIKSALGIGALLNDGIGDTLRVSLTEDPEFEIPVASLIRKHFGNRRQSPEFIVQRTLFFDPYNYKRRLTLPTEKLGGKNPPVIISGSGKEKEELELIKCSGYQVSENTIIKSNNPASDYIYLGEKQNSYKAEKGIKFLVSFQNWHKNYKALRNSFPLIFWKDYGRNIDEFNGLHFVHTDDIETPVKFFEVLDNDLYGVIVLRINHENPVVHTRTFFRMLGKLNIMLPVILHKKYNCDSKEEFIVKASAELGSLLNDGYGDGLWLEDESGNLGENEIREIAFGILQATGTRISKTEYISCPSCGRTLFDIQKTLKKIKEATSDYVGLKIAVMGCIVNGPGEMADADFGYVGAGKGKVSLYKGKEEVKKNIPEEEAVSELVQLIKSNIKSS